MGIILSILSIVCAIITFFYFIVVLMSMIAIENHSKAMVTELRTIRADFQAFKRANNIIG